MDKNKGEFVGENGKNAYEENNSRPWFECEYATYMNRAEYISSFYAHPFIEPPLYEENFAELKAVDLYCCVGNNDCALDCNIDLARMWKGNESRSREKIWFDEMLNFVHLAHSIGKACLDVFDKLPHAFLQLASLSTEATEAVEIFAERLQEACGLV